MALIKAKSVQTITSKNIIIRSASVNEAQEIKNFYATIWEDDQFVKLAPNERQSRNLNEEKEWINRNSMAEHNVIIVAEFENLIVGVLHLKQMSEGRRLGHVARFTMTVLPDFQQDQIGKFLVSEVLDWVQEDKVIEKIALEVISSNNAAVELYRAFGFLEEGRLIKNIKLSDNEYCDTVFMYKWIK